jgi:hypothetical protein
MKSLYVKFENETESRLLQELAFAYGKSWTCNKLYSSVPADKKCLVIYKDDDTLYYGIEDCGKVVNVEEWISALKNWPPDISLTVNGKKIELSPETRVKILEAIE